MPEQLADVGRGITIAYETIGSPSDPPVVLIMGLGTQMIAWPDDFCAALAARGRYVIRFDNRDCGLSTHLHGLGSPPLSEALLAGGGFENGYRLTDMAQDVVGLLDALGLPSAHIAGASMGGMIAQTLAFEHPDRVASLTSIMSTTGDRSVGQASQAALEQLMAPVATSRDEQIERSLSAARVIGSPGFELDEESVRDRAGRSFDRCFDPPGVARQLAAVLSSGDRTESLARVSAPAVVIHGADDALVNVSGGRATAAAIPGARFVEIPGLGHDLPRGVWPQLIDEIVAIST